MSPQKRWPKYEKKIIRTIHHLYFFHSPKVQIFYEIGNGIEIFCHSYRLMLIITRQPGDSNANWKQQKTKRQTQAAWNFFFLTNRRERNLQFWKSHKIVSYKLPKQLMCQLGILGLTPTRQKRLVVWVWVFWIRRSGEDTGMGRHFLWSKETERLGNKIGERGGATLVWMELNATNIKKTKKNRSYTLLI